MDPVDIARLKEAMGHFATGVTVVTARAPEGSVGFTCQSFASLSLTPALVGFAAQKSSATWSAMRQVTHLAVNVLDSDSEALARAFAISGSEKFDGVAYHLGANGAPVLDQALATIEATIAAVHDAGDHEYAIAAVTRVTCAQGQPLLYFRGGFGSFRVD
jgi:3-hydroxy-9,10-secoandrosta-1,3,5(10)-triene-9,17-dione monooxygenase reductase component